MDSSLPTWYPSPSLPPLPVIVSGPLWSPPSSPHNFTTTPRTLIQPHTEWNNQHEQDRNNHRRKRHRSDSPPSSSPSTASSSHLASSSSLFSTDNRAATPELFTVDDQDQFIDDADEQEAEQPSSSSTSTSSISPGLPSSSSSTSLPAVDSNNNGGELTKQVKHQLSDRQRRLKIKLKLQELTSIVTSHHHLARTDQMSVISKSVDMLLSLQSQVAALTASLKVKEKEKIRYENEMKTLQQQCTSFSHVLSTLNNQGSLLSSPSVHLFNSSLSSSLIASGVSVCRLNIHGHIFEVNETFRMLTEYSLSELVGRSITSYPLYSSIYRVPSNLLSLFTPLPVLDEMDDLHRYDYAVNNDFRAVFLAQQEDEVFRRHSIDDANRRIDDVHTYSTNVSMSVTNSLFSSPCVIPLSVCKQIHCADYSYGPGSDLSKNPKLEVCICLHHLMSDLMHPVAMSYNHICVCVL